jgi:hypothetical protein
MSSERGKPRQKISKDPIVSGRNLSRHHVSATKRNRAGITGKGRERAASSRRSRVGDLSFWNCLNFGVKRRNWRFRVRVGGYRERDLFDLIVYFLDVVSALFLLLMCIANV